MVAVADGGILAVSDTGLWRAAAGESPVQVARLTRPVRRRCAQPRGPDRRVSSQRARPAGGRERPDHHDRWRRTATGSSVRLIDLRRDRAFERVLLSGLDVEATRELVAGRADPEIVHARTAGNPFFMARLLGAEFLTAPGPRGCQGADFDQRVSKLGVGEVLESRARSRGQLRVRRPDSRHWGARAGRRGPRCCAECRARGQCHREQLRCTRFAREAIYEDLSAMRRASLHLRLAETLDGPAAALRRPTSSKARQAGQRRRGRAVGLIAADEAAEALDWSRRSRTSRPACACSMNSRARSRHPMPPSCSGSPTATCPWRRLPGRCRRAVAARQPTAGPTSSPRRRPGSPASASTASSTRRSSKCCELALAQLGDKDTLGEPAC